MSTLSIKRSLSTKNGDIIRRHDLTARFTLVRDVGRRRWLDSEQARNELSPTHIQLKAWMLLGNWPKRGWRRLMTITYAIRART